MAITTSMPISVKGTDLDIGDGPHGGGPGLIGYQGNFAERIALAQLRDHLAA